MRQPLSSPEATAVGPYSHGIASDPFVFLSGKVDLKDAAMSMGADDFVSKPFEPATLLAAVRRRLLLGVRSADEEAE